MAWQSPLCYDCDLTLKSFLLDLTLIFSCHHTYLDKNINVVREPAYQKSKHEKQNHDCKFHFFIFFHSPVKINYSQYSLFSSINIQYINKIELSAKISSDFNTDLYIRNFPASTTSINFETLNFILRLHPQKQLLLLWSLFADDILDMIPALIHQPTKLNRSLFFPAILQNISLGSKHKLKQKRGFFKFHLPKRYQSYSASRCT